MYQIGNWICHALLLSDLGHWSNTSGWSELFWKQTSLEKSLEYLPTNNGVKFFSTQYIESVHSVFLYLWSQYFLALWVSGLYIHWSGNLWYGDFPSQRLEAFRMTSKGSNFYLKKHLDCTLPMTLSFPNRTKKKKVTHIQVWPSSLSIKPFEKGALWILTTVSKTRCNLIGLLLSLTRKGVKCLTGISEVEVSGLQQAAIWCVQCNRLWSTCASSVPTYITLSNITRFWSPKDLLASRQHPFNIDKFSLYWDTDHSRSF